jgi:2-succinyl-5-enolpyruvyl-6-hydroxy-3-cyclohexene-1-carboxylate synthase
MKIKPTLFAFLLVTLAIPAGQGTSKAQTGPASAAAPEFPGFFVAVTLSEKAKAKLLQSHETIIVAGYLVGDPKKGAPKKLVDELGQIDLGEVKSEVQPAQVARFGEIKIKKEVLVWVDANGPQLLINVYSGRKSSKDNLLDCGLYEGALKPIQGTTIPISCKLIGE